MGGASSLYDDRALQTSGADMPRNNPRFQHFFSLINYKADRWVSEKLPEKIMLFEKGFNALHFL